MIDRAIARMQTFHDTKSNFPKGWRAVSDSTEAILSVTPEGLEEINDEILVLLERYRERVTDRAARPSDAVPVELLVFRYPVSFSDARP